MLVIMTVVAVDVFLAAQVVTSSTGGGSSDGERAIQAKMPYMVLPSEQWQNGYTTEWTMDGVIDAAARRNYMIVTFVDNDPHVWNRMICYAYNGRGITMTFPGHKAKASLWMGGSSPFPRPKLRWPPAI